MNPEPLPGARAAAPAPHDGAAPIIELLDVYKRFGALHASRGVSLTLVPGEIHALIGPNGAGKSTLIQQIAGFVRPDSGSVRLNGEDITALSTAQRARRGLARTFQISALAMEDSVLQNTVLGAIGASSTPYRFLAKALGDTDLRGRAEDALQRVGLLPQAQQRTSDLSHGQRRLLEVAVALTLSPVAFVMDEPMAGLGVEGSASMTRFLDGLREQAPILLVEHDMDAVFALADRISVLMDGEIIAMGTVEEIRSNARVRSAYLGDDA